MARWQPAFDDRAQAVLLAATAAVHSAGPVYVEANLAKTSTDKIDYQRLKEWMSREFLHAADNANWARLEFFRPPDACGTEAESSYPE